MKRLLSTASLAAVLLITPVSLSFAQSAGEASVGHPARRLARHQRLERERLQDHEQRLRRRAAHDGLTDEERDRLRAQFRAEHSRLRQHQRNERQRLRDHRRDRTI